MLASPSLLKHEQDYLWLTIKIKPTYIPSLESLHCCGFRYSNISSEIIFYKQPDPRSFQFLSLDPLVLDISKINASGALFDASPSPMAAQKRIKLTMIHSRPFMSSSARAVTDDMNVTLQQVWRWNGEKGFLLDTIFCDAALVLTSSLLDVHFLLDERVLRGGTGSSCQG